MPNGNISVVVNYEGHGPNDAGGYVQFTRGADGRVYIVVDRRPVGTVDGGEFDRVQKLFTSKESE